MFALHLDITSTDHYSFVPFGEQRTDAYSLVNVRAELSEIDLGQGNGQLKASLWAKMCWMRSTLSTPSLVGEPAVSIGQAFGDPRTMGIELTYQF